MALPQQDPDTGGNAFVNWINDRLPIRAFFRIT